MRLAVLILLLCSFSAICASPKTDIDTLHQRAYRMLISNPDSAFALGVLAEAKAANDGLDLQEAQSIFIQAYIYRQRDELGKAFVLYLKALEILRTLEDEAGKLTYTKILLNTGEILKQHYAYTQALQYYDEGIAVAQEYQYRNWLASLYYNKAETLRQVKDLDQASITINMALQIAENDDEEDMIISSLNQQGLILKDMGRYEEARESYRKVINFAFDQVAPEKYKGQAWHNIAVTYLEEKRYAEAEKAYLNALAENEKRHGSREEYITWMDLGETYYLMGYYNDAYQALTKARTLYDDMLLQPDHYAIFRLLSKTTYELGRHDESHAYSEQYMAVNKRFLQAQKEILQVKDQYKMEILTAGFFLEIEAAETEREYQMMLIFSIASAIFLLGLFGYEKVKLYNIRRSINRAIFDIEQKSSM